MPAAGTSKEAGVQRSHVVLAAIAALLLARPLPAQMPNGADIPPFRGQGNSGATWLRQEPQTDALSPESVILPPEYHEASPSPQLPAAGNFSHCDPLSMPPPTPLRPFRDWGFSKATCDGCPTHGLVYLLGYDSWRSIVQDGWQNNGIHTGLNYGTRLGRLSELTAVGFQVGGSIGVYDWSGTDYRPNNTAAETQGFLSYGFFRKQTPTSNWSAGIVQDWMFNNNFGVFSQSPTLSQFRAQASYAISAWTEFGVWGAWSLNTATADVRGIGPTAWRSVDLVELFWHQKWQQCGADTWLYVGAPVSGRLTGSGSTGSYIASAAANVPLCNSVALYTLVTYMRPAASAGPAASEQDAWNFTIGLAYYFRRNARTSTVAGQCWMPLMPVANNGYFIVDTNHH